MKNKSVKNKSGKMRVSALLHLGGLQVDTLEMLQCCLIVCKGFSQSRPRLNQCAQMSAFQEPPESSVQETARSIEVADGPASLSSRRVRWAENLVRYMVNSIAAVRENNLNGSPMKTFHFLVWRFFCCSVAVFKAFLMSSSCGSIMRRPRHMVMASLRLPFLYSWKPITESDFLQRDNFWSR